VLHNFRRINGKKPLASLIDVGGTLYGTTYSGGSHGGGTVFSISTAGKEQVLHKFGSGSLGKNPAASLIDMNGTLYGTTRAGRAYGRGTVFALNP
jgi:uncharacterized repeat protein (TIGR03803 family)